MDLMKNIICMYKILKQYKANIKKENLTVNHNCVYKMNHKGIQEWKLNCCQILNSCQPPKVKDNWGDSQTSSSIKFALNIK